MDLPFSYQVIPSRRKTVSIRITPAGEVLVRCPLRMPKKQVAAFVARKQQWVIAHLPRERAVPLTAEEVQSLKQDAAAFFTQRAAQFAPMVGVSYGRITIRAQRTRWGSCSAKGNLNFNCLLMLAPAEVADYVVVHELCHRKHMDHSASFWAEVGRILPDFDVRRRWLKDHGPSLMARLSK
jgi:predicted metal-dependent hydrolase